MKRFFWLVLILLLFLTACGSKEAMTERCTISISCATLLDNMDQLPEANR